VPHRLVPVLFVEIRKWSPEFKLTTKQNKINQITTKKKTTKKNKQK
jgi:hypothetical protein